MLCNMFVGQGSSPDERASRESFTRSRLFCLATESPSSTHGCGLSPQLFNQLRGIPESSIFRICTKLNRKVELLNAHVDSGCLLLSMREAQRERER